MNSKIIKFGLVIFLCVMVLGVNNYGIINYPAPDLFEISNFPGNDFCYYGTKKDQKNDSNKFCPHLLDMWMPHLKYCFHFARQKHNGTDRC